MKHLPWIVFITAMVVISPVTAAPPTTDGEANPVENITSSHTNDYAFVGFTPQKLDGTELTISALTALCRRNFGSEARLASSKEYLLSPNASIPAGLGAWLRPVIVGTFLGPFTDAGQKTLVTDYSGVTGTASLNCYSIGGAEGLVVGGTIGGIHEIPGQIRLFTCSSVGWEFSAACSAPVHPGNGGPPIRP